jgi:hypothetical protein
MSRAMRTRKAAMARGLAVVVWVIAGVACSDRTSESGSDGTRSATSTTSRAALTFVALGDSWPQGDHMVDCGTTCRPFPMLWAEALETQTGMEVDFQDFTGMSEGGPREQGKGTASLLAALRETDTIRDAARNADVILIATGPNEGQSTFEAVPAGTCVGPEFPCVRALGQMWSENFDAILSEIDELREGEPIAVRLVNAASLVESSPPSSEALPSALWLQSELLTAAVCDAAAAHDAVCVDVRPLFTAAEENTPASMQAVADALVATGLRELD